MERSDADNRLIQATLRELDAMRLATLDVEGKSVGVSGETVRKWRAGTSRKLNKNSRPLVDAFLAKRGVDVSEVVQTPVAPPADPMAEVRQILSRESVSMSEQARLIEVVAAAARSRALELESQAAHLREIARANEAGPAGERVRALAEAERGANERARATSIVADAAAREMIEQAVLDYLRRTAPDPDRRGRAGG
jgi:hypothetical protein